MRFKSLIALLTMLLCTSALAQEEREYQVRFKTNVGSFTVKLYNETPLHRDNFLALVRGGHTII